MKDSKRFRGLAIIFFKWLPYWTFPAFTGFVMILLCYLTGALAQPKDDAALRVFNAAIAMPIFVVYGWVAVLVMKRRAIVCLIALPNLARAMLLMLILNKI